MSASDIKVTRVSAADLPPPLDTRVRNGGDAEHGFTSCHSRMAARSAFRQRRPQQQVAPTLPDPQPAAATSAAADAAKTAPKEGGAGKKKMLHWWELADEDVNRMVSRPNPKAAPQRMRGHSQVAPKPLLQPQQSPAARPPRYEDEGPDVNRWSTEKLCAFISARGIDLNGLPGLSEKRDIMVELARRFKKEDDQGVAPAKAPASTPSAPAPVVPSEQSAALASPTPPPAMTAAPPPKAPKPVAAKPAAVPKPTPTPTPAPAAKAPTPAPAPIQAHSARTHALTWDDISEALGCSVPERSKFKVVATIAHALSLIPPRKSTRTTVWLVGASDDVEGALMRNGRLAEPLATLCPSLGRLEFWLIGPAMTKWTLEPPGQNFSVKALPGLLHAVVASGEAASRWPDLALLLNSRIGSLILPQVEPWLPTLTQLIQLNIPLLFTCADAEEARGTTRLLREAYEANVTLAARESGVAPTGEAAGRGDLLPRSNRWLLWIQGTLVRSRLQSGVQRARVLLRKTTKEVAAEKMHRWVAALGEGASDDDVSWVSLNLSVATEDKQIARYAEAAGALPALRAAVERRVPARMRGDEDFVYEAKMAFSRRIDGIRPESIGAYASMTAHERLFKSAGVVFVNVEGPLKHKGPWVGRNGWEIPPGTKPPGFEDDSD